MVLSNGAGVDGAEPRVDNSINPFSNDVLKNLTLGQKIQVIKAGFNLERSHSGHQLNNCLWIS